MATKRWTAVLGLLVLVSMILSACAPAQDPRVAELEAALATAQASGQTSEELAALQQQLAEAQAAASGPQYESYSADFKNPDTLTNLWIGEPETLDTAIMYDSPGIVTARHLYDGLLFLKGSAVDEFVPMLADEWSISDDGLTYTFHIREGVKFHKGGTLEAHDVAYTFHRNMLLGWDSLGRHDVSEYLRHRDNCIGTAPRTPFRPSGHGTQSQAAVPTALEEVWRVDLLDQTQSLPCRSPHT